MKQATTDPSAPVRLCFLSYPHLSRLAASVFDEYAGRARIEVVEASFQPAVSAARAREQAGDVDAFVSAGSNAVLLREAVASPVATIKANGYDILLALLEAGRHAQRVGVVTFGETIPELEGVKALLNIDIAQRAYRTVDEARECFRLFAAEGRRAIVGSSIVVEMAQQQGLHGILCYSADSVRQGIDDAIEMGRVARLESARHEQVNAVLHNLQEAVLAVDRSHRITAVNAPMQKLLQASPRALHGRALETVAPELTLAGTLATGERQHGTVLQFAGREWVANRTPLREADQVTGAVLALYDAHAIEEADSSLRTQRKRRRAGGVRYTFRDLRGDSPALQRAVDAAHRFAATDLGVLVTGESGTGKELLAQAIHHASARGGRPFVALNCSALPESLLESELFGYEEGAFTGSRRGGKAGLFEAAHTGTLFLDEIGDMPLLLQTRLLRVLQEREVTRVGSTTAIPVDVRVIAATHQPLPAMIAARSFRADLYYRLNHLQVALPPLRERAGDVAILALHALHRRLAQLQCSHDPQAVLRAVLPRLQACAWPGNVRELENVCDRVAVYFAQFGTLADATPEGLEFDCPELRGGPGASAATSVSAPASVHDILVACGGSRARAAAQLGISRATLWRRLKQP
jgi:propionate catabolism operon transcriptional regulator